MLKRPNVQFFKYKGLESENNLVNIDLAIEVYTSYQKYEFKDVDYEIYKIVFLMVNGEEVIWNFNDKKSRDLQYYNL